MVYIRRMKKSSLNGSEAQGVDTEHVEEAKKQVTVETTKEWLKKDLGIAITCLNAMYTDPDLLENLAEFLHGRWMNAKHKE